MDENSWQVELVKSGINITKLDTVNSLVYFDFAYRPKPGAPRVWGKSVWRHDTHSFDALADQLRDFVLEMRKGLEG